MLLVIYLCYWCRVGNCALVTYRSMPLHLCETCILEHAHNETVAFAMRLYSVCVCITATNMYERTTRVSGGAHHIAYNRISIVCISARISSVFIVVVGDTPLYPVHNIEFIFVLFWFRFSFDLNLCVQLLKTVKCYCWWRNKRSINSFGTNFIWQSLRTTLIVFMTNEWHTVLWVDPVQ